MCFDGRYYAVSGFITGAIGAKFPGMNHLVEGVVDTTVSAGERLAYAVFDDSMSWDEKWAYAFDPGQMVADFVTGVVIGEILDGIMAAIQNRLRSIFANYDAAMREAFESGSKTDVTTGLGYDAGDTPVRIDGDWTENDMKQALLGHPPRGLGSPDIHHGGQMPGGALHEVLPGQHRNNPALHPNTYNQGVTPEMRMEDRQLHWWYRAREQGADELLPDWIYD